MKSGLWAYLSFNMMNDVQTTMFQPVGGMDMIGKAFGRQVNDLVTHNAKIISIAQDDGGVSVSYIDTTDGNTPLLARADYCVCTIPLPVLSQLDVQVSAPMKAAIAAVPYHSSVKVGPRVQAAVLGRGRADLRRHQFHGSADQRHVLPEPRLFLAGPRGHAGRLHVRRRRLGFCRHGTTRARQGRPWPQGSKIHKQYPAEFSNGVGVAWSRMPWTLGCCSAWSEEARKTHYKTLTTMEGPHSPRRRTRLPRRLLAGGRIALLHQRHHAAPPARRAVHIMRALILPCIALLFSAPAWADSAANSTRPVQADGGPAVFPARLPGLSHARRPAVPSVPAPSRNSPATPASKTSATPSPWF